MVVKNPVKLCVLLIDFIKHLGLENEFSSLRYEARLVIDKLERIVCQLFRMNANYLALKLSLTD